MKGRLNSKNNLDDKRALRDLSQKLYDSGQASDRSAAPRPLIIIIPSVFIADAIIMFFLSALPPLSLWTEAIVGAMLLVVLVFPILYYFSFKPLLRQMRERFLAGVKLRQSEEKFRSLAENSPNMIFINKMGRIVYANKRCVEVTKFTKDEFYSPDFDFLALIAPESICFVKESFSRHQNGEDIPPYEYALITKDGRKIEAMINTKVIEYEGEIALLGVVTDITERKRAEEALRQSEEKFRMLAELLPECVFETNENGIIIFANRIALEKFGYTREEYERGVNFIETLVPDDRERAMENATRIMRGEKIRVNEYKALRKDGTTFDVAIRSSPVMKEGKPVGLRGVIIDITERKQAEQALRKSEALYHQLVETSQDLIWRCDAEGKFTFLNKAWEKTHGYKIKEMSGRRFTEFQTQEVADRDIKEFSRELAGCSVSGYETTHISRSGEEIHLVFNAMPLYDDTGNVVGTQGTAHDITERKRAEEALRDSEARLSDAQRIAGLGYWEWEIKTQKSFWSDKMFELYKRPKSHGPLAETWMNHVVPEDKERVLEAIGKAHSGDREYNLDHGIICMDGEVKQIHTEARVIRNEQGEPARMVGIVLDITERKRAEEALRESEERFRTLVESQGEGVGIIDPKERFVFANPATHHIFGVEPGQLLGKSLQEFLDPDQFEIVRKHTSTRHKSARSSYEVELVRRDGEKRLILVTATPLSEKDGKLKGVLGVFRDMTEMRKMEEEMVKSEKLESLGLLAGGIAHDFNNALTVVLGNTSMLKAFLDKQDDTYSSLEDVERAAMQARALTQQLLTFSKGGAPVKQTASIVELVKKTVGFMLSGSNVICEYSVSDDIWAAKFDTGQIGQVIQNLILNADQAMPEGGILRLNIENIYVKPEHSLPLDEGKHVKITIRDQGTGIPEKHLDKIFDPFFTTKSKGNGLGLAIAYSIIKKHSGYINVESQFGEGTTFHVYLPASDEKLYLREGAHEEPLSGTGKILVVDDEEFIRVMLTKMLMRSGYTVRCAADGVQAIEMYKNERELGEPFDAVLMDLTIPGGIGGREAVKKLREIDPDVKAIVSSGYSNDPIMADYTKYGFNGCLAKPYRAGELNNVLSEVVNRQKVPA